MAPENLCRKTYNKEVDIWSFGIILFMLFNQGKHPFYEPGDTKETYREKCKRKIKMCYHVSKNAKSLLAHLMDNQHLRYSAEKALQHKWFSDNDNENVLLVKNIKNNLKEKFKKMCFSFVFIKYYSEIDSVSYVENTYIKNQEGKTQTISEGSLFSDKSCGNGNSVVVSVEEDINLTKDKKFI